jgi:hypothetical protein
LKEFWQVLRSTCQKIAVDGRPEIDDPVALKTP